MEETQKQGWAPGAYLEPVAKEELTSTTSTSRESTTTTTATTTAQSSTTVATTQSPEKGMVAPFFVFFPSRETDLYML